MRQLKITKSITNRESASLDKYLACPAYPKGGQNCVRETYKSQLAICRFSCKAVSESGIELA